MNKTIEELDGFCGALRDNTNYRLKFSHNLIRDNAFLTEVAKKTDAILITGPTGTGKEYIAEAFNKVSGKAPMVSVNCAGLNDSTLLSELFGYMKGAFTGANIDTPGAVENANNGTLFLDEIGDAPDSVQKALLRFLDKGQYYRLGETGKRKEPRQSKARIISATNKNLPDEIKAGRFRQDLYYRLNVFAVHSDPFPEIKDDKYQLIEWELGKLSKDKDYSYERITKLCDEREAEKDIEKKKKLKKPFSKSAEELLVNYPFPGNYRELQNILKYSIVKANGNIIDIDHLPDDIRQHSASRSGLASGDILSLPPKEFLEKLNDLWSKKLEAVERDEQENLNGVARQFNLTRQQLTTLKYRKCLVKQGGKEKNNWHAADGESIRVT